MHEGTPSFANDSVALFGLGKLICIRPNELARHHGGWVQQRSHSFKSGRWVDYHLYLPGGSLTAISSSPRNSQAGSNRLALRWLRCGCDVYEAGDVRCAGVACVGG